MSVPDLAKVISAAAAHLTADELAAPIVVGVSGGVDSLALLHLLWRWSSDGGPALWIVHVHHGLRPEADADAERVRSACDEWQLPLTIARVDVGAIRAERKAGLEDAARLARYRAFAEVAASCGARVLALAHQADDQAETLLLHLFRGAGLPGLGAMKPVQRDFRLEAGETPLTVWRPLLEVPRAALDRYCRQWRLQPVADATNSDLTLRRNALRHDLIPRIERYFPQARVPLARAARLFADDDAALEEEVERRWLEIARVDAGLVFLERAGFRAEPRAVQRRLLRRAWRALRGETAGLTFEPVEAGRAALAGARTGQRHVFPHGLVLIVDRDTGILGDAATTEDALRARAGLPLLSLGQSIAVAAPGAIALAGGWRVEVATTAAPETAISDRWTRHIPLVRGKAWVVRTWQPGDRIRLPGGGGSKKLQDWFVDRRVPDYLRGHLTLVAWDQRVVWVAGMASFPLPQAAVEWVETGDAAGWLRLDVFHDGARMG